MTNRAKTGTPAVPGRAAAWPTHTLKGARYCVLYVFRGCNGERRTSWGACPRQARIALRRIQRQRVPGLRAVLFVD